MRLLISHQSKKIVGGNKRAPKGLLTVLALAAVLGGCQLGVFDHGGSSSSGDAEVPTVQLNVSVPNPTASASVAADSITASDVFPAEIDEVRIAVHRTNDGEDYVSKLLREPDASGTYQLDVAVPVNTHLVVEAVGINLGNDETNSDNDEVVAYGKRSLYVGLNDTVELTVSLSQYSPAILPQTRISDVLLPAAACQGQLLEATVEGYVPTSEWPKGPTGAPLDTIDLITSTFADDSTEATTSTTTTLHYADAANDRVTFTFPTQVVPAADATTITLNNEFRLIPGVTFERSDTLDVMGPVTYLGADGVGSGSAIDLSWTLPSGSSSWFAGVVVMASQSEVPQTNEDGTEVYEGTGTSCTHTGLTTGQNWNYAVIPFTESDGVRAYGPPLSVSATPIDTVPPAPPSDFVGTAGTPTTTGSAVTLSWVASNGGDGADHYVLLRKAGSAPASYNDSTAATLYNSGLATSYSDYVTASGVYYYALCAVDAAGNVGAPTQTSVQINLPPPATVGSNITAPGIFGGTLSSGQGVSAYYSSKYADVWTFTIYYGGTVTIDMESYGVYSDWFDTYLYLYNGATPSSSNLITRNDDGGNYLNSRISIYLSPGTYSIEASHYGSYRTGSYRLNVQHGWLETICNFGFVGVCLSSYQVYRW